MYKICVFIPASHLDQVKSAMFNAGAGRIGNYDQCSWQTLGTGQFRPLDKSNPYLGEIGKVENVEEYKIEMICSNDRLKNTIKAMKKVHPYEEPAFDVWQLADI